MKVQINCNQTKDKKIKGRLVRSKVKVEPLYRTLTKMVVNTLDIPTLNKTHVFRIYRDLSWPSGKIKEHIEQSRVQIISITVTSDKLGLVG